jgi:hypothetical protein
MGQGEVYKPLKYVMLEIKVHEQTSKILVHVPYWRWKVDPLKLGPLEVVCKARRNHETNEAISII